MNLIYNIDFELAAVCFTVITLIYHFREFKVVNEANVQFRINAIGILVTIFFDILASYMISNPTIFPPIVSNITNALFYITFVYLAYGFSRYCVIYIIDKTSNAFEKKLNISILVLYILSLILNVFFHFYFYVNSSGNYVYGKAFVISNLVPLYYVIYGAIKILRNRKKLSDKQFFSLFCFVVILLLGDFLQVFFINHTLILMFMFSIGNVLIMFELETPDYQKLLLAMKQLEEKNNELAEANLKVEAANQAKTIFLAKMSHEIRTPMNAIIGFSEIMLKNKIDKENIEYVENIRKSSYNLLSIINEILDISKIESGKLEIVNDTYEIKKMLVNVIVQIKALADKKGLEFEYDISPNLPKTLYSDEVRIKEILINILNNAVKYTEKGFVKLSVNLFVDTKNVNVLCLKVEDSGIGIDTKNFNTIFQDFEQVNRSMSTGIEGTGLGLSIVKGYVDLMDGELVVTSTPGVGSTFTVCLPQIVTDSTPIGDIDISSTSNIKSNIGNLKIKDTHVLVVDDNLINLKVISKGVECYGLVADTVDNGKDAINMCKQKEYDIVFMDIMMPQMDGYETMQKLRKVSDYYKAGRVKIVALTANAIKGVREEILSAGFDNYLKKPIEFDKLEQFLIETIDNEKVFFEQSEDEQTEILYINGIDTIKGISQCGGSFDEYIKVLQLVMENCNSYISSIENNFDVDLKKYVIDVHAVKGMCYNIGADQCGDLAKKIEFAGKETNIDFIRENNDILIDSLRKMVSSIKESLNKISSENTLDKSNDEENSIDEMILKIKNAVRDYDFPNADKLVTEMLNYNLDETQNKKIIELKNYINDIDIEAVEKFEM